MDWGALASMIQLYWICKLHLSAGGGSYPQVNMTWHANCSDITPVPAGVGEKLTGLQQGEFCTSNRNGGNREAGMLPGRFDRINISQPPIGRCGSFGDAIKFGLVNNWEICKSFFRLRVPREHIRKGIQCA